MATVSVCDGCESIEGPMKRLGHVMAGDYCPNCAPDVKFALDAIDRFQEGALLRFADLRKEIAQAWWDSHDKGRLPDGLSPDPPEPEPEPEPDELVPEPEP